MLLGLHKTLTFGQKNVQIVTDGLVLNLDAGDTSSYPGSGTTWYDISGNGNHVTLYNGITYSDGALVGNSTSSAYGRTNNTLNLSSTNKITVFSIFKDPTPLSPRILYEHTGNWNSVNSNYGGFGLSCNTNGTSYVENGLHIQLRGNVGYSGRNTYSPNLSNYQVYTTVYDFSQTVGDNETKNYINGEIVTTTFGSTFNANNTGSFGNDYLYLWSRGGSISFNDGKLARLIIYNRALSSTEIQQNYNALRGRYGIVATGGTIYDEDGFRYHIFTSSGTFAATDGGEVEVLLVAGGGAGARQSASGGGGGAGGVLLLDGVNALTVASSTNYTVTVGTGGVAVNSNGTGANGTDSSFIGGSISETAIGGGGGQGNFQTPGSGGSGGGGQGNNAAFGTGTSGQGSDGGRGSSSGTLAGGGGGGASQAGTAGSSGAGGKGGDGSSIWGSLGGNAPGAYGGGGGGSTTTNAGGGSGGSGGGGGGQGGTTPSTAGSANTGGGGGAGYPPSSGGSGIVIVRYRI